MSEKIINNFSGGLAQDIREPRIDTFTTCKGFNSTIKEHKLVPYGELEAEALSSGDITDRSISDITIDSNGLLIAVGINSSASPTVFDLFGKDSTTDISSTWTSFTSLSGAGGYKKNSLVFYNSKTYVLDTSFNVRRYDGSWSNVGAIDVSSTWTNMLVPKPIIHSLDDILYLAGRQALAKIDGTTYSDITGVSVPVNMEISSLCEYGGWLAIAATPLYNGQSKVFLWNRDTSVTTFSENINWGEDNLLILENIGGTLIGVSTNEKSYTPNTTYSSVKTKKITIRAYNGGTPQIVKEFEVDSNFSLKNYKQKYGEKLYFGGDYDDSLYVVYKDKNGRIIVSKDNFLNNGSTITTFNGFFIYGDYLFSMFNTSGGNGKFYRTKVTSSYTSTAIYESLINPDMPEGERSKKKKLEYVAVSKETTTGALAVYVSVDGGSYNQAISLAANGKLGQKETRLSTGGPFTDGYEYKFKIESTNGAEPTELRYFTTVIEK